MAIAYASSDRSFVNSIRIGNVEMIRRTHDLIIAGKYTYITYTDFHDLNHLENENQLEKRSLKICSNSTLTYCLWHANRHLGFVLYQIIPDKVRFVTGIMKDVHHFFKKRQDGAIYCCHFLSSACLSAYNTLNALRVFFYANGIALIYFGTAGSDKY